MAMATRIMCIYGLQHSCAHNVFPFLGLPGIKLKLVQVEQDVHSAR